MGIRWEGRKGEKYRRCEMTRRPKHGCVSMVGFASLPSPYPEGLSETNISNAGFLPLVMFLLDELTLCGRKKIETLGFCLNMKQ